MRIIRHAKIQRIYVNRASDGDFYRCFINGTSAASASQPANLTARHVQNDVVLWEANQIETIDVGQSLGCNISTTNDEWSDLQPLEPVTPPPTSEPPTTNLPPSSTPPTNSSGSPTGFIGLSHAFAFSVGGLATIIIVLSYTRKKKKR